MEDDSISIDTRGLKEGFRRGRKFLGNKKVQTFLTIFLLTITIIVGCLIRTQNLPLLKDSTTGEYIPVALDPFYFLRIADTIVNQGGLPHYDPMRQPFKVPYTTEILPQVIVFIHKVANVFGEYTIQHVDVIYPIMFFALGLIAFFLLVYVFTNSKLAALLSSVFLTIIPAYLYRTMAGFADHEPLGMFVFFLTLMTYTYAMKFLNREARDRERKAFKVLSFGVGAGLLSSLTIASWGGVANFIFMIIPLSFGIFWLVKSRDIDVGRGNDAKFRTYISFYMLWIVSTFFSTLFYGYGIRDALSRIILTSTSILTGAVLLFVLIDFLYISGRVRLKKETFVKYRVLISVVATFGVGLVLLLIMGNSIFSIISDLYSRLFNPFAASRVGSTVAENAQPYLNDWINQTGKIFFWLFLGGLITIGINFSSVIKQNKDKGIFVFLWILFIFGLLFSRISSSSIFNGANFISHLFYLGSTILFGLFAVRIYFKDKIKVSPEMIIIFSWTIFMLIAARSAVRTIFLITPFACFSYGIFMKNIFRYWRTSKDDLLKMILSILIFLVVIASLLSFYNLYLASKTQAKTTGPSANYQWQNAMEWVRDNTPENSIFLHWWDYGYWIQYLGERPTLADGGHFQGQFRNHLIGRYVLTTPKPETALSFMKSNNASYLLIDPTDLGKYGAYSIIGSGPYGEDRVSQIPMMVADASQTKETSNGKRVIYAGGTYLDEDIIYPGDSGEDILLPANRAGLAASGIEFLDSKTPSDAFGIFVYNNKQIIIPIRYVYFDNHLFDLGGGLNATLRVIPSVSTPDGKQINVDQTGTIAYLSPRVSKSLFAQLYLMGDPFNEYPTIRLVHSESDPFINSLNQQGANIGEFLYFQGFRGPIKIWDTRQIPNNILAREEFLRTSGEYAEFDNLDFIK